MTSTLNMTVHSPRSTNDLVEFDRLVDSLIKCVQNNHLSRTLCIQRFLEQFATKLDYKGISHLLPQISTISPTVSMNETAPQEIAVDPVDDEQDLSDLDVDIGGIERAITEEKDEENEQSKDNGNDHSMEAISPITEIPCRTPPSDSRERDSDKSSGRSAEQEIALNLDDFANRSYTFPKSGEFEPMNANDQTNDARSDAQWSDFNSMNSDDRSNGNENRSVHVPAPISLDSPPKDRVSIVRTTPHSISSDFHGTGSSASSEVSGDTNNMKTAGMPMAILSRTTKGLADGLVSDEDSDSESNAVHDNDTSGFLFDAPGPIQRDDTITELPEFASTAGSKTHRQTAQSAPNENRDTRSGTEMDIPSIINQQGNEQYVTSPLALGGALTARVQGQGQGQAPLMIPAQANGPSTVQSVPIPDMMQYQQNVLNAVLQQSVAAVSQINQVKVAVDRQVITQAQQAQQQQQMVVMSSMPNQVYGVVPGFASTPMVNQVISTVQPSAVGNGSWQYPPVYRERTPSVPPPFAQVVTVNMGYSGASQLTPMLANNSNQDTMIQSEMYQNVPNQYDPNQQMMGHSVPRHVSSVPMTTQYADRADTGANWSGNMFYDRDCMRRTLQQNRPYRCRCFSADITSLKVDVPMNVIEAVHAGDYILEQSKGERRRNERSPRCPWSSKRLQSEIRQKLGKKSETQCRWLLETKDGRKVLLIHSGLHFYDKRSSVSHHDDERKEDEINYKKSKDHSPPLFVVCLPMDHLCTTWQMVDLLKNDILFNMLDVALPPFKFPYIEQPKLRQIDRQNANSEGTDDLIAKCLQEFHTRDEQNNTKLAFAYYKESAQMALFRGNIQRHWVFEFDEAGNPITQQQNEILLLNVDLTQKGTGNILYFVAKRNDCAQKKTRENTPWKVFYIWTSDQIQRRFGYGPCPAVSSTLIPLPVSSRDDTLRSELNMVPTAEALRDSVEQISNINFKPLISKSTKQMKCGFRGDGKKCKCQEFIVGDKWTGICANPKCGHSAECHGRKGVTQEMASRLRKREINEGDFKKAVRRALLEPSKILVPVVVNKDNQSWIEWKRFIPVMLKDGTMHSVGVSLRWFPEKGRNGRWQIQCLDYDAGRIYEQHRLISDWVPHEYRFEHTDIIPMCTTQLVFVKEGQQRGNSRCKGNGNRAHAHNGVVQPAQGVRNSNDNNYSDTRYYNGQSTMVGRSRGQQRSPPVYRRTPPNQQQSAPNLTSWSYANRVGTEADDCY